MDRSTVTLGLIQTTVASDDPSVNTRKAVDQIRQAARKGAQIICLQELFRTPYFCQSEDSHHFSLAESIPGSTTQTLSSLAKELGIVLIAPLFEKRAEGIYHNSAVVIDADGTMLGTYRKMHIPEDPCFYEKFYFTPGDLGFRSFKTRYGKIGVLICWDQWFPEAARLTALQGVQIIFYPTAIGWHDSEPKKVRKNQLESWQVIQRSHAIANEVFVAAVNRVGKEGELTFWGHTFVADPFGSVTAQASGTKEETLIVKCDLEKIEETRRDWPFFRDRRIDTYGALTEGFSK